MAAIFPAKVGIVVLRAAWREASSPVVLTMGVPSLAHTTCTGVVGGGTNPETELGPVMARLFTVDPVTMALPPM